MIVWSPRGGIAQWLEQRTHNPLVLGSSPSTPTIFVYFLRKRLASKKITTPIIGSGIAAYQ